MAAVQKWSEMDMEARMARFKAEFDALNAPQIEEMEAEIAALDEKIKRISKEVESMSSGYRRDEAAGGIDAVEEEAYYLQKQISHITSAQSYQRYIEVMGQELNEESDRLEAQINEIAERATAHEGTEKDALLAAGKVMLDDYTELQAQLEALEKIYEGFIQE